MMKLMRMKMMSFAIFYIYIVQLSVLADVRAAVQQGGEDQDREQHRHGRLRPRPWQVSTS
jgi:hypothetical protein